MKICKLIITPVFFLITSCIAINKDTYVMVPMRDDVKLSTQFIFPENVQNKYPVILVRTPYQKERLSTYYKYFVENGYVLALQNVRGRYNSEGEFEPFVNECEDGYDAIEWIADQNWCNGNIGMIGVSYDGWVQYCAAVESPPHLKTIIPNCSLADLSYDIPYRYGIFTTYCLTWSEIIEMNATADISGNKIKEIYNKDWEVILNHLPVAELDSIVFSKKLGYYQKWIEHNTKDEYWTQACTLEKLKEIKIPVFIQTGWYDSQLLHGKLAYSELSKSANKNVKMIIGPWGHVDKESKFYNGEYIGEAADDINLQSQYLRWFDYWLKDSDNGIMEEPLVQLYAIHSDKWYSDNTYPLINTSVKKLFLSSNNNSNVGDLFFDKDIITNGYDHYKYNPENVSVYKKGMKENPSILKEVLTGRDDYLLYKSESLKKSTTILGQLSATIFASSSAKDTDWYLVLFTMDENENFLDYISLGMLRAKFRNSLEQPELLEKNKIYKYNIDLSHCGLTLEKGQKIGLIITSSIMYPYFAKNLNIGKNNQTEVDYEIAEQKIYHTNEYPSYISLTILNDESKN